MQAWSIASVNNVMVDASTSGTICTGIVKLAQRFLITFLNEVGSIKYNYWGREIEQGTRFMLALRMGRMHTDADVFAEFAMAELQARQQLKAEETGDEPDDERYKSSELKALELSQGEMRLTIDIQSQSDSVQIILPIPVMVPA
jgi:hypothetical protein